MKFKTPNRKQKLVLLFTGLLMIINYLWMLHKQAVPKETRDAYINVVGKSYGYTPDKAMDDLNLTKIRTRELAKNNFYTGMLVLTTLAVIGCFVFNDEKKL